MIQVSALNVLIVTLMMVIGTFLLRMAANALTARNPDSGFGQALSVVI